MDMVLYLTRGIEEGRLDYKTIFNNPKLKQFKVDVDSKLTADGFQHLIVPIQ